MKRVYVILIVLVLILGFGFLFRGVITGNVIGDVLFKGVLTGLVIGEDSQCNVIDFNGDGAVDYKDKAMFILDYEKNFGVSDYCGYADVDEDGDVDIFDSNKFAEMFSDNYGVYGGVCDFKLKCEKSVVKDDSWMKEIPKEDFGGELNQEKGGFFDWIKNLFK